MFSCLQLHVMLPYHVTSSSTLNAESGTFAHVSQLTGFEIKIRKQIVIIWIKHFENSLTFSVNSISVM
jgi:hypothetical protein